MQELKHAAAKKLSQNALCQFIIMSTIALRNT